MITLKKGTEIHDQQYTNYKCELQAEEIEAVIKFTLFYPKFQNVAVLKWGHGTKLC